MDQIIGTILYAAESPSYSPRSIVFTDREVLQVPPSKIGELANRASGMPVIAAWLAGFSNPAAFSSIGGLVGMKKWGDLKKQVSDKAVVSFDKGELPDEIKALLRPDKRCEGQEGDDVERSIAPARSWLPSHRADRLRRPSLGRS